MKSRLTKTVQLLLVILLMTGNMGIVAASGPSANEIVHVSKTVSPTAIVEGGEAEVTLQVKGSSPVNFVKPNDIILIVDRSGSMSPSNSNGRDDKIGNAKAAAQGFIDMVDMSTHQIGVVDFSTTTNVFPMTTDKTSLKNYIGTIQAGGGTATGAAILKSRELLKGHRGDAQPVIVLLTDGEATHTTGPNADPNAYQYALEQATAAKAEGIVFYTIALLNKNDDPESSPPNKLMKEMATTARHHHFVLGSVGLKEIYEAIVKEIGMASAYDVEITDVVAPEFELVKGSYDHNIPQPTVVDNKLTWNFLELKEDLLTFTYKVKHKKGSKTGVLPIGGDNKVHVKYTDYLGQKHEYDLDHPTIEVSYNAPVITSIIDDRGPIAGGNTVTIKGEHFQKDPIVKFGANLATSVKFIDEETLEAVVPAGDQGTIDVTVTNADGQSAQVKYHYYAEPVITDVQPSRGPLEGENEVIIKGDYFLQGASVKFGTVGASVLSVNKTEIKVKVPSVTKEQVVDVSVLNPDQTSVTADQAYTYAQAPSIASITPNEGLTTGHETVSIKGERFEDGAKVYFAQKEVQSTFVSDKEITIETPVWGKAEVVDVRIVNPDGQEIFEPQGFKYVLPAPQITEVTPNTGLVSGNTSVTIKGQYFVNGAKVFFNDKEVGGVTFYSANELRIRTPEWKAAETVAVKVVNPDGKESVPNGAFEYQLPAPFELDSITPAAGPLDGGTVVKLSGKNFVAGSKLFFNDKEVKITALESTQITASTPKWEQAETVNVKVVDPYGRDKELKLAFEYLAPPPPPEPTIESISPAESELAGGILSTVIGTNFDSGAVVYVDGIKGETFYYGSTQVKVKIPAGKNPGQVDVKVVNATGKGKTLEKGFTYLEPPKPPELELTSITPNESKMEGGVVAVIKGKNISSKAKVKIGDTEVATTFYGPTEVRVTIPKADKPGKVTVTLNNGDGQEANLAFTYLEPPKPPAPTITAVTPNEGLMAGGYTIAIKGTNFAADSKVFMADEEVATTFYGPTEIRINVPASTEEKSVTIKVVNADGQQAKFENAFKYIAAPPEPAPELKEVTPNEGYIDGGYTVKFIGANFKSGTKAYIDDVLAPATFYSSQELRVQVPAAAAEKVVDVKVVNPDTKYSVLAGGFKYILPPPPPTPAVTSIDPAEGSNKGGYYIFVNGSDFDNGAAVFIDDVKAETTFYSNKQLRVKVPASVKTGAVDVKVVNKTGKETTESGGFNYLLPPPPSIASITPNEGALAGGYYISLKGAYFENTTKVYLDDQLVQSVFYSSNELRARVPAAVTPGFVNVKVENEDGQKTEIKDGFKYLAPPPKPAPVINSVDPNSGKMEGGYYIVIKGANFTAESKVFFGSQPAAQIVFYSAAELRARVPASSTPGAVDIKVVNGDQEANSSGAFTYIAPPPPPAPTIATITPNNGAVTGGTMIVVKGSNFKATSKIYVAGQAIDTIFYGSSELRGRVPAAAVPGSVEVMVKNNDGSQDAVMPNGFTYNP